MSTFSLHPHLASGTHPLGHLHGCRILLKDHAQFPWILIVPEVPEPIEDLHELDDVQYAAVTQLIRSISQWMSESFQPTKMNVACIGNQVRQMHVHLVARSEDDPAWPGTVWAYSGKQPYHPEKIREVQDAFSAAFPVEVI